MAGTGDDPLPALRALPMGTRVEIDSLDVPQGGEPYVVTTSERIPCQSGNRDQNGAVRMAMSAQDIIDSVHVAGLVINSLTIQGSSTGGAVITAKGSWNGLGGSGTVVLYRAGDKLGVRVTTVTVGGVTVPSAQVEQAAESAGLNLAGIALGFKVDRVFNCPNVLMIEGHH